MRLKQPHGGARNAEGIWPLIAIWGMGLCTEGEVKSPSPPLSSSHSRVEKPKARTCFEMMPHPAKNSVNHFWVTRTGGDCLLIDGPTRWPRLGATRFRSTLGAGSGTGRSSARGGRFSRTGSLTWHFSTGPAFESPAATLPGWLSRRSRRCVGTGKGPLGLRGAVRISGLPSQGLGR